jgi:tetratricopeptide (TPR) repeat protein
MKSKIIVLLLLFTWNFGLAQNKLIDSLKYQLAIAKQDTSRVLIMADLARSYSIVKPDSGMKYAQQALELAQKIKYLEGEATALNNLAGIYREQGDLPSAMNLILKAFSIAEAHQFVEVKGECYSRFGSVYFDLKDFTKSLYYNQRAYEVSVKLNDQLRATNHMMNIGSSFLSLNQLDSAIHYTQLAYERVIRLNLTYQLQTNFRTLGRIQVAVGNNQLALDYFKQSIEAAIKMNESRNASYSYNEIGRIFLKQNQIDSCIFYAKKGLAYAQVGPFNKRILESSVLLAEAFKNKNDFKQAYEYQELMVKTKESLYSAGNIQAMQTMLADDETRRKEVETERIANKNRLKQYTLLTGLAMLLLFTFFLYRNIRQKQKANKVLKSTLTNLKSTQSQLIQSEKMASLGELTAGIAHEIQNPLNFVNNFSEVNKELLAEMNEEIEKGNYEDVKIIAKDVTENEKKINPSMQP